jgi:hypothetical protein
MREQLVREQYRLGTLQVGVTRDVVLSCLIGPRRYDLGECEQLIADSNDSAPEVKPQSGRDLIVPAPTSVDFRPDLTSELGHPALDCGVNVFVAGLEYKRVVAELGCDLVERPEQHRYFIFGKNPCATKAVHVRDRAPHVVFCKPSVSRQTLGEGHHHCRRLGAHPAGPKRHEVASPLAPPWRRAHVSTPRP